MHARTALLTCAICTVGHVANAQSGEPGPPPTAALPPVGQPEPTQNPGTPPAGPSAEPPQYSPPPSDASAPAGDAQPLPPPPPGYYYAPIEPPVPPPANGSDDGFHMPPWSIRIDPFTWLLEGRLGLELEAGITKWMTAELVPVFVTTSTPPTLDSFSSREDAVHQASNGLGPISGTSLGLGFWLGGHALHGYVLRAIFTDYGYTYRTFDDTGARFDQLSHTERQLIGMIGSHSTFGAFTIAGDFGLGVDLNHQVRCVANASGVNVVSSSGCNGLELGLANGNVADVSPSFYPVVVAARLSLGVTFD